MTLDPTGRVVVSGRGYIKILADDDRDGRADRAIRFADGPSDGAMGLLWEGDTLFVTGDGGLRRYRDADGDDRADGPSELICALKTGGEHDAHAIRRGPDGWLYVMVGNFGGIDRSFATRSTSPIVAPVAGCLLRFSPDLKDSEIVADGFRNAYDFDFDPDGEIFTFDSDNERCVSLPWYEFTRVYHVIPGGHHGWLAPQRADFWRYPPSFEDVVAPVTHVARGSPTGVVCDRRSRFPEPYRGGFFLLDWTFGLVYFLKPERSGSSFSGSPEVFLRTIGDEGFAPTDAVIHPRSGDLLISIGGRGTRGAVYVVRYVGDENETESSDTECPPSPRLPPGVIERSSALATDLLGAATGPDALDRLRALTALKRHRDALSEAVIERAIQANWDRPDRPLRRAASALIATLDALARRRLFDQARSPWQHITLGFGVVDQDQKMAMSCVCRVFEDAHGHLDHRLAAVRLFQRALGGLVAPDLRGTVWEGYSARLDRSPEPCEDVIARVRALFPSNDPDLDRELSRTLAMRQDDHPKSLEAMAGKLTEASDPVEDLHYLIVISRLRADRSPSITNRVAAALLAIDRKLDDRGANRDRHWPLRVAELYEGLASKDPALHSAVLSHPEFGRPDHALFAESPGFNRPGAAERFLEHARSNPDFAWSPAVLKIVGTLPMSRSRPILRRLWGTVGLDDAIVPILASNPEPADREKFLEGLRSMQPETVLASLKALEALPSPKGGEAILPLMFALRRAPEGKVGDAIRDQTIDALRRASGRDLNGNAAAWFDWFEESYPDLAPRLSGGDDVDLDAWKRRLKAVPWSSGEGERGRSVFQRAQCATCHSGNRAVGPDLKGVANRFSQEDLFTSILQPDRDVSHRYRAVVVATEDGSIYQGMAIYEAVDGLILQTGPTETVRIDGSAIEERRETAGSLMPVGLLDGLTDQEIADLYAYLKTLR